MGKLTIRDYRQYLSIFLPENGSKSAELLLAYTNYFLQLPYQKKMVYCLIGIIAVMAPSSDD